MPNLNIHHFICHETIFSAVNECCMLAKSERDSYNQAMDFLTNTALLKTTSFVENKTGRSKWSSRHHSLMMMMLLASCSK